MNDDLVTIRHALVEREPSAEAFARGRAQLIKAARRPTFLQWSRRHRTLVRTGVAVTAAAAIAVMTVPTGSGAGRSAGPATVTPASGASVDGRDVLLTAAESALHGSGSGRFWVSQSIELSGPYRVDGGYNVVEHTLVEQWFPRDGSASTIVRTPLGAQPATASDMRAWKASGSPSTFTVPATSEGDAMTLSSGRTRATVERVPGGVQPAFEFGGCRFDPAEVLDLARDESGLAREFQNCAAEGEQIPSLGTVHPAVWQGLIELLASWPASPDTRAAAFRLLAAQTSAHATGSATDPLGRAGEGLSLSGPAGAGSVTVIVDPTSGQVLAESKGSPAASGWTNAVVDLGGGWTDRLAPER